MPVLKRDKIVNNINVKNNFILVENSTLKLKKKVSVFSLHDSKNIKTLYNTRKFTQDALPEPGIFLHINNNLNVLLEEDEENDIVGDLLDKYRFFAKYFEKDLKFTLFKPVSKSTNQSHIRITDDSGLVGIITEFNEKLKNCMNTIKYRNIQPKLIAGGSSGTYIIFGSDRLEDDEVRPVFIFKPMNEEPYSKKFQPKWLKYLQFKLLPFTFGRECLLDEGNYGYITDLMVSRLDYLMFRENRIVPWCDVCVLESGSFFNKFKKTEKAEYTKQRDNFFKRLSGDIVSENPQGMNFFVFWFTWIRKLISKIWELLIYYITGGHKLITIQRKLGSVQVFELGFVTAKDFFETYPLPSKDLLEEETFGIWDKDLLNNLHQQLQRLYILDFITRNTDRNLDNWMLRLNESKELTLKAIDNSLAFPFKHPSSLRTYPFEWLYQLPRYLLEKPLEPELIRDIMAKLTNPDWWNDWRLTFWECHSRSGKVFVSSNHDDYCEAGTYFDNPFLSSVTDKTCELNIDSRVNLQWSLFKGQAFLLYKLMKAGLCGISVNSLDLVQMERCYVHEDPCYYYHQNISSSLSSSKKDEFKSDKLKKLIWDGLGLDVNAMFNYQAIKKETSSANLQGGESQLDKQWKLYLSGDMTDEEWFNYLREHRNNHSGLSGSFKTSEDYNPFQETNNEEADFIDLENSENRLLCDSMYLSPSNFTIASSLNNDTSLISEYFYDAMSTISNPENNLAQENQTANCYESLPINVPALDERNKDLILRSNNSVLSKTPVALAIKNSKHSYYIDHEARADGFDKANHYYDHPTPNLVNKYDVEVVYIDRLEICQEQKPFFINW